jgi:hypothetical protein
MGEFHIPRGGVEINSPFGDTALTIASAAASLLTY